MIQRRLHLELQAVLFLITRRVDVSLILVSILFLPGVVLHEVSHYLMAAMLGVPTGKFSLIPRPIRNGRLQLGFVETAKTDIVRDAIIGVAPLATGCIFIAFVSISKLDLLSLEEVLEGGESTNIFRAVSDMYTRPDFWLWFFLAFVVSSTMMPSSSDRRAWLPVALTAVILLGLGLIAGAGPWMWQHFVPLLNRFFQALAMVIGISLAIHIVLIAPLILFRILFLRLSGFKGT